MKSKADRDRYLKEKSANNIKKFTEERKSLAVKQDKRREKLKNQHQAQISDLDKYVQNVSIIIVIFELNSCFDLFFSFSVYGNVQKWRNWIPTIGKTGMFCLRKKNSYIFFFGLTHHYKYFQKSSSSKSDAQCAKIEK